jgi:hypothetical protein
MRADETRAALEAVLEKKGTVLAALFAALLPALCALFLHGCEHFVDGGVDLIHRALALAFLILLGCPNVIERGVHIIRGYLELADLARLTHHGSGNPDGKRAGEQFQFHGGFDDALPVVHMIHGRGRPSGLARSLIVSAGNSQLRHGRGAHHLVQVKSALSSM